MSKIILHVDFNSFFASVEQQANPFLRGKAIAITGKRGLKDMKHSIVATASVEAKRLGVKTPMPISEARRICPELILLHGDMRKYSEITKRLLSALKKNSDAVEQFSTDEAFADITSTAQDYFGATIVAQIIRNEIAKSCGKHCTVSIGVGPNKTIAKLASNSVKPNGLTIVQPQDVKAFLDSQPLGDVCGIGKATEKHLENLGISSFGTLRKANKQLLLNEFKTIAGSWLYDIARGISDDHVSEIVEDPKSIGHSYTFPHDLDSDVEIQTNLLALSDRVAYRLRRDGFSAGSISIFVRYSDFSANHAQLQTKEMVQDGLIIYKNAWAMIDKIRDTNKSIRLIGVSTSNLTKSDAPMSLFQKDKKMQRTLKAHDCIAVKFGQESISRASTMNTSFKERASGWHYDHEI
ncbi:DNA polymerase IV [Candidatus Uhrbacteria bacterium]|jgi:DNA polymerase IV|nr:DNA polymerase IV [Candidatus Uhrbacteria bacterium]MBT7717251.1 DNA polymerase IV [Candidatus Uhrbacteria bacterium]